MSQASIRGAAEHIARTGKITPHQLAAFTALDETLTDPQRQGFTDLWRAAGSPAAAAPLPLSIAGPSKKPQDFGFKAGDSHVIVSDLAEIAKAYSFTGKPLWQVAALARGQSKENNWQSRNSDTPPGLYKIGQVYDDWARYGDRPPQTSDVLAYGWLSFDLIGLEGQEGPGSRNGRDGIMVHGGGSACGFPGCWLQIQPLHSTYGCIRMHNIDLRDKLLPLVKAGTVFVSVYQER